jgi:hypothetical protein
MGGGSIQIGGDRIATTELTERVESMLDYYLEIWAAFVGLGREVDGPNETIAELSSWWLVYTLGDRELSKYIWKLIDRGNPWPENKAMRKYLFVRVIWALKNCQLLGMTRLEAADRLVERWNPFPFDPKAKVNWRSLTAERKKQLLEHRVDWLIEECEELAKRSRRPWRFDRRWLKDARSRVALCKFDELPFPKPVRALRNAVCKRFESEVLQDAATYRDHDAANLAVAGDGFGSARLDDQDVTSCFDSPKLKAWPKLSPREDQLIRLLEKGHSRREAAALMQIALSTARVLTLRVRRKFLQM